MYSSTECIYSAAYTKVIFKCNLLIYISDEDLPEIFRVRVQDSFAANLLHAIDSRIYYKLLLLIR